MSDTPRSAQEIAEQKKVCPKCKGNPYQPCTCGFPKGWGAKKGPYDA